MPLTPFETSIDEDLYERAKAKAASEGKPLADVVSDLVKQWVGVWQPPAEYESLPQSYMVESGDSLWTIAEKYYGDGNRYTLIANANNIHKDRRIYSGMRLVIPPFPTAEEDAKTGKGIFPTAGAAPKQGYPIVPDGLQQIKQVFGAFEHTNLRGTPLGRVQIKGRWVSDSIVVTQIPSVGSIQCHRLLAPVFKGVFGELESKGLAKGLRYYGCFVARHKMWNPKKDLSVHSWGIAIDLNADTNGVGTAGSMDVRVIRVFADHGFYWGGNFGDPMHFQYCLGY